VATWNAICSQKSLKQCLVDSPTLPGLNLQTLCVHREYLCSVWGAVFGSLDPPILSPQNTFGRYIFGRAFVPLEVYCTRTVHWARTQLWHSWSACSRPKCTKIQGSGAAPTATQEFHSLTPSSSQPPNRQFVYTESHSRDSPSADPAIAPKSWRGILWSC